MPLKPAFRTFKSVAILTMGILWLATSVGCATDAKVIAQAQEAHGQLEAATIKDPVLANYVQALGDRVVVAARELVAEGYEADSIREEDPAWMFEEVKFHLVASDTLNAFTTGGTHVYLYSELFTTSKTEDEFSAVVAHEFAHIFGRHVHNGMNNQMTAIGIAAGAAAGGYALGGDSKLETAAIAGGGALAVTQFMNMGFTRSDEDQADKFGFQFYVRAGWDPELFSDFFKQMIAKGYDTTPQMMSSHPMLKNRVLAHERRMGELGNNIDAYRKPPVAGPARFRELQARVAKVKKQMPNDESLKAASLMLAAFPSCVAPLDQPSQTSARSEIQELLRDQE